MQFYFLTKKSTIRKRMPNTKKGFALLLAVLVAGVVLSITYLMFSINLKQLSLATAGTNSQYALYAADTGIECALFADNKLQNEFVTVGDASDGAGDITATQSPGNLFSFTCNSLGVAHETLLANSGSGWVVANGITYSNNVYVTTFDVGGGSSPCAAVTVSKYILRVPNDPNNPSGPYTEYGKTKIESRGYNTCTPTDPQRVERGLEVYY